MASRWAGNVYEKEGLKDWWFRDFRHQAATRWSRLPNVSASMLCEGMGWSINGGQFSVYINARQGGIADALK